MLKRFQKWLWPSVPSLKDGSIPLPEEGLLHIVGYYKPEIKEQGVKYNVPVVAILVVVLTPANCL